MYLICMTSFLRDIGVETSDEWRDSIRTLKEERNNPNIEVYLICF